MATRNEGARAPTGQMPLFYERPEVLDPERHGGLRFSTGGSFAFAAGANAIPLNLDEFQLAGRHYPIVFVGSGTINPVAVVGLRTGENLFVDASGVWAPGVYVPAYVRRYPFIFMEAGDGDRFLLCADMASGMLGPDAGNPLFVDGKMSETALSALKFCTGFQRHSAVTARAMAELARHDLLRSSQARFTLPSGQTLSVTDFRVIDENKLNALGDSDFLALRRDRLLAGLHCHLLSLNGWQDLVRRKV